MSTQHTPGPWRWAGEDYRGGWGWQLLVGPEGQGILCGEAKDGIFHGLRAHTPIDPALCKTGSYADESSAPCVHVMEADARLIAAAPELLEALELALSHMSAPECAIWREVQGRMRSAIAKATGSAA